MDNYECVQCCHNIFKESSAIIKKNMNLYGPTHDKLCEGNLARHQKILEYNKAISTNPDNQSNRLISTYKKDTDGFCCNFLKGINVDLETYDAVLSPKENCVLVTLGLGVGVLGLGVVLTTSIIAAAVTVTVAVLVNKFSKTSDYYSG